jgi:hypothetical protein
MHLFTNGCSWTYGGALELDDAACEQERLAVTWPGRLAKKLNATFTNIATGGGSNQRVVRTTIDWIYDNKDFIKNEEVMAIIQWSDPSRFEYYEPENKSDLYESDPSRWAFGASSFVKQQTLHHKTAEQIKDFRLYTHTHQEAAYSTLYHCLTLAKIFDIHNIKYYFWSPLYSLHSCRINVRESILDAGPWLDQDHENLFNAWEYDRVGKTSWTDYDAHPSRLGHEQLSYIILNELKKYEQSTI